jgi:hypothetical protein
MTGAGRTPQRRPLRRVLYRSKAAIVARFGLGVVLGGAAFVVASPALSTDYPPPPAVGLYIVTNSFTAPWGELELAIEANGCTNPAIVEGVVKYPEKTWTGPRDTTSAKLPKGLPSTAVVALGGARLVGAQIALGNGSGVQADGEPGGPFSQPPFRTTQTFAIERNVFHRYTIRSHSYSTALLAAVIGQRSTLGTLRIPAGAIALHSRQWVATKAPLHFRLAADLVQTASYHRCYVAVPEVLALNRNEGYGAAEGAALRLSTSHNYASQLHFLGPEFPPISWDVLAASVDVTVSGRIPVSDSVGPDGKATSVGVHYGCRLPKALREAAEEPYVLQGEVANSNCSATPLFAAQGVDADISLRLFLGGLIGGLAATLIIEALFIGETPDRSRDGSRSAETS